MYIGNKLSKHGYTPTSIEYLGEYLENSGFNVWYSGDEKSKFIRLFNMVRSIFKHSKYIDFVLIDTYSTLAFYYAIIVALCCKIMSLKYIPILHGGNLPYRLEKSPFWSDFIFRNSKINVSPSIYLQSELNRYNLEATYIPNPIEIGNYTYKVRSYHYPKILWVRSFDHIYNPLLAIQVFSEVHNIFPESELCMVGPDKDGSLKECKKLVKVLQLDSFVTFPGKMSKLGWTLLSERYNIFINTTNYDNMPVSVIEAMALGLSVVSTNVGGIPYLLDEKAGYLVPPDNKIMMRDRVIEVMSNSKEARDKTLEARKIVEKFDYKIVMEQWNNLLRNLHEYKYVVEK